MNEFISFNPDDKPQRLAAALQSDLLAQQIAPMQRRAAPKTGAAPSLDLVGLARLLKDDTKDGAKPKAEEPYQYGYM